MVMFKLLKVSNNFDILNELNLVSLSHNVNDFITSSDVPYHTDRISHGVIRDTHFFDLCDKARVFFSMLALITRNPLSHKIG